MRDERYIEIPGSKTHELPPLLVHSAAEHSGDEDEGDLAAVMSEADDMLAASDVDEVILDRRRYDLALQLKEQYKGMLSHWLWGESVLEWIRQCEITFECEDTLRKLLHPDVWPHANRASFVTLLVDKAVPTHGVALEKAVGLRLTFRQPPPINCISNQFLFYLNSTIADSAYQTWSHLIPQAPTLFPPERFHFDVLNIEN
ncbi:MAG TPA: hypothetical protein VKU19_01250 [Bryobacteraceae bacterium]|nr:hypothetical protein [Bryobacteraceae bacterium]